MECSDRAGMILANMWHAMSPDHWSHGVMVTWTTGRCWDLRYAACNDWSVSKMKMLWLLKDSIWCDPMLHVDIKTDHKHSLLVTVWWDAGNMEQVSSLSLIISSRTMLHAANIWHQRVDPGPGLQQLIWNIETSISVREALISILGPNICSAFWWLPRNSSFTASYLLFFGLPWE